MDIILKLINMLDGWKRLFGYAVLNIPFFNQHPMLLGAVQDALANPGDQTKVAYAIAQALLAWGMVDGLLKQLGFGPDVTK